MTQESTIKFTRIKRDISGNPRYVINFLDLFSESELGQIRTEINKKESYPGEFIDTTYKLAIKKAKTIGGKKYRGMDFGGGIVFQSYNIKDLEKQILGLRI